MNKHGLKREIPEDIKRQIRKNSGFGCVICGLGIIQYEHVEPEYHEAKLHEPSKMTLLCPGCHSKVTTGMWSKEKVKKAMANPKALSQGYSNEIFDIGNGHPQIRFAGSIFESSKKPITAGDIPIMQINPPHEKGGFFLINAVFFDSKGMDTLKIVDNEWIASSENWDVTVVGNTITIRESLKKIILQITAYPPNTIEVSRLVMYVPRLGYTIRGDKNEFSITKPSGGGAIFNGVNFSNNGEDIKI